MSTAYAGNYAYQQSGEVSFGWQSSDKWALFTSAGTLLPHTVAALNPGDVLHPCASAAPLALQDPIPALLAAAYLELMVFHKPPPLAPAPAPGPPGPPTPLLPISILIWFAIHARDARTGVTAKAIKALDQSDVIHFAILSTALATVSMPDLTVFMVSGVNRVVSSFFMLSAICPI